MTNITPIINPLMQPITYKGKTYFTGQYFHQMYRDNSDTGGKYNRAKNFMRLVRSIETYQSYIDTGDIVELERNKAGSELEPVFKATYGKPIMLINATAQVALTHHLDDEVSKHASVAVNSQAAEQPASLFLNGIHDPTLGALVKSLVELDQLKQQQAIIIDKTTQVEHKTEALEQRVEKVEIQHRNGVPLGYISKKNAHYIYSRGLSVEAFHMALEAVGVPKEKYVHQTDDGFGIRTYAYKDDDIQAAVDLFIDDARQISPHMCESQLLKGRRFRFAKEQEATT